MKDKDALAEAKEAFKDANNKVRWAEEINLRLPPRNAAVIKEIEFRLQFAQTAALIAIAEALTKIKELG